MVNYKFNEYSKFTGTPMVPWQNHIKIFGNSNQTCKLSTEYKIKFKVSNRNICSFMYAVMLGLLGSDRKGRLERSRAILLSLITLMEELEMLKICS